MNLEFTFSVSSDIIWRVTCDLTENTIPRKRCATLRSVTCDLTENTPFIRNVFWGNTEIKDISPSILELIEEQAMKELAERAAETKHEVMGY